MTLEEFGNLSISWTIRVSLLCYFIALVGLLVMSSNSPWRRSIRFVWLAAALIFVLHVIAAFAFRHHWSHTHAFNHTAEVTEQMIHWRFGEGIYFSYLFTVIWLVDAIWWTANPASYSRRSLGLTKFVHVYIFFIAFNGAVIFEDGPTRPTGIVASLSLAVLLFRWLRVTKNGTSPHRTSHDPDTAESNEAACQN